MNKEEKKDAINKIRDFFSSKKIDVEIKEVEAKSCDKLIAFAKDREKTPLEKFEDLMLSDGSMIMIEPAVEAGAAIAAQTEDSEWVPAPPSSYELEDGRVVVVVEDGIIDSVQEANTEEEVEVVEEDMNDNNPKRVIESIVKEKIFAKSEELEDLKRENKFLLESVESQTKEITDLKNQFNSVIEFTQKAFEDLLSEPVAEPVIKYKNPFKKEKKRNFFLDRINTNDKN